MQEELQAMSEGLRRELALRRELNESRMLNSRLTDELEDKNKAIQNKEKELQQVVGRKRKVKDAVDRDQSTGGNAKRSAQALSSLGQASLLPVLHYCLRLQVVIFMHVFVIFMLL
jgi:hypothetical protein